MSDQINLVSNGNFREGELGSLPQGWSLFSPEEHLAPDFHLTLERGVKVLSITGNGNENCVGWVHTTFSIDRGSTYRMKVRFRASEDVHPYDHLLFSFYIGKEWKAYNNGIFTFN